MVSVASKICPWSAANMPDQALAPAVAGAVLRPAPMCRSSQPTGLRPATMYRRAAGLRPAKCTGALCFHGFVGNWGAKIDSFRGQRSSPQMLQHTLPFFQRHLLRLNQVDVFVHSWSAELRQYVEKMYHPARAEYVNRLCFVMRGGSWLTGCAPEQGSEPLASPEHCSS